MERDLIFVSSFCLSVCERSASHCRPRLISNWCPPGRVGPAARGGDPAPPVPAQVLAPLPRAQERRTQGRHQPHLRTSAEATPGQVCLNARCLLFSPPLSLSPSLPVSSYKLWYRYLKLRRKQVRQKCVTDPVYEEVNNAFERALVFMHKVRENTEL